MTTFETRALLPTNLRPIEYAKSIQRKMYETWFYQAVTRIPVTTGTVRTNISVANFPAVGTKAENASVLAPVNPTFSQKELALATYQASVVVSNELFEDTANLMEFLSASLADAMATSIADATMVAVRNEVLVSRVSTSSTEYQPSATELMYLTQTLADLITPAFVYEQSKRGCFVMHPSIFVNFINQTTNVPTTGVVFRAGLDGVTDTIWGRSVYTSNAMRSMSSTTPIPDAVGAHILFLDLSKVVLYEQPLVVSIDMESAKGNNQSIVYATQRAVGAMMDDTAIQSLNLKAT